MYLAKKIAIGLTTGAILGSAFITPAFAARAINRNISNNSFATAMAIEMNQKRATVVNGFTMVTNDNMAMAETGNNFQMTGGNNNTLRTGAAQALSGSTSQVNTNVFNF